MTVESLPWGYRWRSSQNFIIATATIKCFLFGFVVPILPYMLESRLHIDPSRTQTLTTTLLTTYGFVSLIAAPVIAHFADKTPRRKGPLLLSLTACAAGTVLVACSRSVWVLMAGQFLQSLSSASVWIVAFATLVDNVDPDQKGKIVGVTMSFVSMGIFAGPTTSGVLHELLGYWPAWSAALGLLVVDFCMRVVMLEARATGPNTETVTGNEVEDEQARLLSNPDPESGDKPNHSRGFYRVMLTHPQILAALANTLALSILLSAFDTTLPLHAREAFNWGSLPVGLLFFGLQIPTIIFSPTIGWLRDRVGPRWPTTVAWGLMGPLLWMLSFPGHDMPWGRLDDGGGKAVFISGIAGLGFCLAFTRGAGTFQMMAVVEDIQAANPHIFGPYGGNSRLSGLTELPFSIGMILGPLLSGTFSDVLGYYYSSLTLGILSAIIAVTSWVYMTDKGSTARQKGKGVATAVNGAP